MKELKQFLISAWEVLEVVFVAAVTVFLIRSFLVQPFLVSGASMEPNFSDGNYLLVDEITYRFREPERGEVIVFRYPHDRSVFFIKRLIGMPGERVIAQNGKLRIVDGEEITVLNEDYLPAGAQAIEPFDIILSNNQYFILGDNRFHSFDSRNWGAISRSDIIGVARLRIFPFKQFSLFEAPLYE